MGVFCNFNGKIIEENTASISVNNRSFRYGDGCFETIKVIGGKAPLWDLHIKRLFSTLQTLNFSNPVVFTPAYLHELVLALLNVNSHAASARVRLTVFSSEGGLFENDDRKVNFIIQTWEGKEDTNKWDEAGLHLALFTEARITADRFSALKTNNYLRPAMAAIYATANGYDDCILTNAFNRIADSTIANVFIVNKGVIKTPPLSEGAVDGVMRRYLLESFISDPIEVLEQEITITDLLGASEVFLTNAIIGVRSVKQIQHKKYDNALAKSLYTKFIDPLWKSATI